MKTLICLGLWIAAIAMNLQHCRWIINEPSNPSGSLAGGLVAAHSDTFMRAASVVSVGPVHLLPQAGVSREVAANNGFRIPAGLIVLSGIIGSLGGKRQQD